MDHRIEIASFERGELTSTRVLSTRAERRSRWLAGTLAALFVAGVAVGAALVARAAGFVLHAPVFFVSWAVVGIAVARRAAERVGDRERTYHVGSSMNADAFAPFELDLVRRSSNGDYEIALVRGMNGSLEEGRAMLPVEAIAESGKITRVPAPDAGAARIDVGDTTFVIRRLAEDALVPAPSTRQALAPLPRLVAVGAPAAALASMLGSTPAAMAVTDADMRSSIPMSATPFEVELKLREQGQRQAESLHQCFESLPPSCFRNGYVGVGLDLERSGEVREHWIARSTFDDRCPVNACMEKVVANWFFEPVPERMRVVIPVQVRENRSRFAGLARTSVHVPAMPAGVAADPEDAGPVGVAGR